MTRHHAALFIVLNLASACALAGSVTLAWDPVPDSRVGGYQILYGTAAGTYGEPIDVPGGRTINTFTVPNLEPWTRYYFVARAHNQDKTLFSMNSNEVNATLPLPGPGQLKVTVTVNVAVGP